MAAEAGDAGVWATGLVLCVSGFDKPERRRIEQTVTSAGGEYSTSLSRRCTVLLVPRDKISLQETQSSRKLDLYFNKRHKHTAKLLVRAWWSDCQKRELLLDTAAYGAEMQVSHMDHAPSLALMQSPVESCMVGMKIGQAYTSDTWVKRWCFGSRYWQHVMSLEHET